MEGISESICFYNVHGFFVFCEVSSEVSVQVIRV